MIKLIKNKLVVVMAIFAILTGLVGGNVLAVSNYGAAQVQEVEEYTLKDMLTYAIQDEYLARAEYEVIMNEFGEQRPFSNIINSEGYHIELLKPLFEEQGFEIPEDEVKEHVVIPENIETALKTGVQAEEKNIAMYEKFLEKDLPEEVKEVFMVLKNASQNHFNAFERGLERGQINTAQNNSWGQRKAQGEFQGRAQGRAQGKSGKVNGKGRYGQNNRGQGRTRGFRNRSSEPVWDCPYYEEIEEENTDE